MKKNRKFWKTKNFEKKYEKILKKIGNFGRPKYLQTLEKTRLGT